VDELQRTHKANFVIPEVIDGISDRPILYLVENEKGVELFRTFFATRLKLKHYEIIIPAHSGTNFLSVPKILRPIARFFISPIDRYLAVPSIYHDYLVKEWGEVYIYDTELKRYVPGHQIDITWKEAAHVFIDYCDATYRSRTAKFKSRVAYLLICAFGLITGRLNKKVKSKKVFG
jgi:hypothetical protein